MTEQPILSVICNEPDGPVERFVYPFILTEENVKRFWNQAKQFPEIFGKQTISYEELLNSFFSLDAEGFWIAGSLFFIVDDFVGMLSITNVDHPNDALMHFTFYDRRLKGRVPLLREMIKYVMDTYGFKRLSAEIPCYVKPTVLKFVNRDLGLVLEGRKRKATVFRGSPYSDDRFDVLLYGVTREDIEKWELQKHRLLVAEAQHQ